MKTTMKIHGLDVAKTFADKFSRPNDGCWVWMASKQPSGYGKFWTGEKLVRAHRHSFEVFVGPIPDGRCVCHRCDNPACVNPGHLFLGDNSDNMKDCHRKQRLKGAFKKQATCKRGHSLEDRSVYVRIDRHGRTVRTCNACRAIRKKQTRARRVVEGVE